MPYLNLDLDYFDHPKTKRLVILLGKGAEVLPIRLWAYCGKYHPEDGKLAGYSAQEIEAACAWWGKSGEMIQGMVKVGFLERKEDTFSVHQWLEHEGHIKAFKDRARLAAAARWGTKPPEDSPSESDATSIASSNAKAEVKQCPSRGLVRSKNGKKREIGKEIPEDQSEGGVGETTADPWKGFPDPLRTDRFRKTWREWVIYRQEIRHKITATTAGRQLAKLAAMGEGPAIAALEQSITNGWRGIFKPVDDDETPSNGAGKRDARPAWQKQAEADMDRALNAAFAEDEK